MILDLQQFSPDNTYFQMMQTLIPRPIAWVLSENEQGNYNLAPFSFFNAVCSDPALVMLSVGNKPDGSVKDTCFNITNRKYFTIHIIDEGQLHALNLSSASLDRNQSELDELDLSLVEFASSPVPRIEQCKIAYACELYEIHELGNASQSIIYGKVNYIHIDDTVVTVSESGRIKVHAEKVRPISRLGANQYMKMGKILSLARPK